MESNFNEILIKIYTFSFKKMHWKMAAILSRPQCVNVMHKNFMKWRAAEFENGHKISAFLPKVTV